MHFRNFKFQDYCDIKLVILRNNVRKALESQEIEGTKKERELFFSLTELYQSTDNCQAMKRSVPIFPLSILSEDCELE